MRFYLFAFFILFANSAYSMTESQAFSACYAASAAYTSPYKIASLPDFCSKGSGTDYRVFLNTTDGWTYGHYYINGGAWQFNNRDTASCNQNVVNIETDVNLTSVGSASASRGGNPKKPIDFKKVAGVVAAGAVAGAATGAGVYGALIGGVIALGSTAIEAWLKKPTEITQNCTIQIVNNNTSNNSVSTENPTTVQIQESFENLDVVELKKILEQLDDKQFDCVTGGSCVDVPLPDDFDTGTGTGTGDTGTGTGNTGTGTGDTGTGTGDTGTGTGDTGTGTGNTGTGTGDTGTGDTDTGTGTSGVSYTKSGKTFQSVLTDFKDKIAVTPAFNFASTFLAVSIADSECPIWQYSGSIVMPPAQVVPLTIKFDLQCQASFANFFELMKWVVIAMASIAAFKIAVL